VKEPALDEFIASPTFAAALSIVGIVLAVNGGRIAAHRSVATRLLTLKGGAAVALGLVMLAVGLAALGAAWVRGLGLFD
jgi:hypothetical protein